MRAELAGSLIRPEPVVLTFDENAMFDPTVYTTLGHNLFDVICIGAGGGRGGGITSGGNVRNYGGEGGGGGFHRVRGLLSALPSVCEIIIGQGGGPGTSTSDAFYLTTTNGVDGGYSSFNDTTCRASGGKGGKHVESNSLTIYTNARGGNGGKGNSISAGGGGIGGVPGTPTATGPGTPGINGRDGTFLDNIGEGGGGGAGGVYRADTLVICNYATNGGRGAYNPSDLSVFCQADLANGAVPGGAGGAKASPLNGLSIQYGKSGQPGIVVLRLSAE